MIPHRIWRLDRRLSEIALDAALAALLAAGITAALRFVYEML
jgi:hypothetical protein